MSSTLEFLALPLQRTGLFRLPLSQRGLFEALWELLREQVTDDDRPPLQEQLARDYALCERVIPTSAPGFFDSDLTQHEQMQVREAVQQRQLELRGRETKLQYFAAVFNHLEHPGSRAVHLFLYLTRTGHGRAVEEIVFPAAAI